MKNKKLIPTYRFKTIYELSAEFLHKEGISGLILDIDNTLCKYSCERIEKETLNHLKALTDSGIKCVVLSNGSNSRVSRYLEGTGIAFKTGMPKPSLKGFLWAAQALLLPASQIAVVGDQIFTDIFGGNRAGMRTILTEPFDSAEPLFVRFKRGFEKRYR